MREADRLAIRAASEQNDCEVIWSHSNAPELRKKRRNYSRREVFHRRIRDYLHRFLPALIDDTALKEYQQITNVTSSIPGLIMNLSEVELFGTLMRVGTTVETARVLGISQPGVSAQIKRLEGRLGFRLFIRRGNRLVATDEARQLFAEAAPIFSTQPALQKRIEALRQAGNDPIRLSTTPAVLDGFIAPRLAAAGFSGWHRQLRVWVTDPLEDVGNGRAELGVQMAPPPQAAFHSILLKEVALLAVMQCNHPLSAVTSVSLDDLAREALVGYDPSWSPMGSAIQRAFSSHGLKLSLSCEVPHCSTVCRLVAACGGVGIIDAMTADALPSLGLVTRSIEDAPQMRVIAFHRRDVPLRAAIMDLVRHLQSDVALDRAK